MGDLFDLTYNENIDKNLSILVTSFLKKISHKNMVTIFFEKENVVVELIDLKLNKLPIKIILGKNKINIYIGKQLEHYAKDIFIKTSKEEEELVNHLTTILCSEIREVINKDGFAYYSTSSDWKWDSNCNHKMNAVESERIYTPWIE